jgi:hypothetical protein
MFALAFDARSFAPFAFSPVAFAIQALIEEIRRDRANGGGGRSATGARPPARPARSHQRGADVSIEEVRAQWELLELRQRNQAERERDLKAAQPADTAPALQGKPATQAKPITAEPVEPAAEAGVGLLDATRRDDDDALALLLLLAEA